MDRNDDKELWNLLGQASRPYVRGSFADNVLREIRLQNADLAEKKEKSPVASRLWSWLATPLAAGAAALVAISLQFSPETGSSDNGLVSEATLSAINDAAGQIAMNNLDDASPVDDYLRNDDNTVWLADASF